MFQPETEDMLPRMAPKPSSDVPGGVSEQIIRPQVPEISILLGQQDANLQQQQTLNAAAQQQNTNFPRQTYAAWKKQMLPKVTFPASVNMGMQLQDHNTMAHDYNSPRTNLYPMRSMTNSNGYGGSVGVANQLTYRRTLESSNVYPQIQHLPALQTQPPLSALQPAFNQLPNTNSRDYLTICASTQTDSTLQQPADTLLNLATKKDVENVRQILDELKLEQQRMLKMLETILFSNHSQMAVMKIQCRDFGVQANCVESDEPPYGVIGSTQDQQSAPKNKLLQNLKSNTNILQTPKGKPMAQSTAYRPNSPQFPLLKDDLPAEVVPAQTYQAVAEKPISRSASDTSLAMNELALKYLPNEKLAGLLKELNMDCPMVTAAALNVPTTPATLNDKFEKGPSDISNASYKYLKKYRLLPDDHNNVNNDVSADVGVLENGNENQIPQYNCSPQYNDIRNPPKNQRQTPINKCAPHAGRLPLSPLARASQPPIQQSEVPQQIVNLENIKHQPKFL